MPKYRVACILDSTPEAGLTGLDVSQGYLHIHMLEAGRSGSLEELSKKLSDKGSNVLFQWGRPLDLMAQDRSEQVDVETIKQHVGDQAGGLGSAWQGKEVEKGVGGGEVVILGDEYVRVTKGNMVLSMNPNDTSWTVQAIDLNGSTLIPNSGNIEIAGTKKLLEYLKTLSGGKPFFATFDIEVNDDLEVHLRSNGGFPDDPVDIEKPFLDQGGHFIRGVDGGGNDGDLKSLEKGYSKEAAKEVDSIFRITSPILLKTIDEVRIVNKDGTFESPRTVAEVDSAIDGFIKYVNELITPPPPHVVVFGGGAVGTFLAASARQSNPAASLSIVDTNEKRLEQIKTHGVNYQIGTGEKASSVEVSSDGIALAKSVKELYEESGKKVDQIFISTKSYHLTPELYREQIEPYLSENAEVVLVQNGYPDPAILKAIGDRAVVMVVNAGFGLDKEGKKTITNKSPVDLPYGSLSKVIPQGILEKEIGSLFVGDKAVKARFDGNIIDDVLKKTQYACIGAFCAVEAFRRRNPAGQKFTFGNLHDVEKTSGEFTSAILENRSKHHIAQIEHHILEITNEVESISKGITGLPLLSEADLTARRKTNADLENSLVKDARTGNLLELGIVGNLLELAKQKDIKVPALKKLFDALEIIQEDKWKLKDENVAKVQKVYSVGMVANL